MSQKLARSRSVGNSVTWSHCLDAGSIGRIMSKKANPNCPVSGCRTAVPHADDPTVKALMIAFALPAEMTKWTLVAMAELAHIDMSRPRGQRGLCFSRPDTSTRGTLYSNPLRFVRRHERGDSSHLIRRNAERTLAP